MAAIPALQNEAMFVPARFQRLGLSVRVNCWESLPLGTERMVSLNQVLRSPPQSQALPSRFTLSDRFLDAKMADQSESGLMRTGPLVKASGPSPSWQKSFRPQPQSEPSCLSARKWPEPEVNDFQSA